MPRTIDEVVGVKSQFSLVTKHKPGTSSKIYVEIYSVDFIVDRRRCYRAVGCES